MLYEVESKKKITRIPHHDSYKTWHDRLAPEEYQAITDELHSRIDGEEIKTSSWIPGNDWRGTVFQPIYEKACRHNYDAAARFFGIIVWCVFMEHKEKWGFGKYKLNDIPIKGMTYFRVEI